MSGLLDPMPRIFETDEYIAPLTQPRLEIAIDEAAVKSRWQHTPKPLPMPGQEELHE
jgi:hypothetical protein